VQRSVKNRLTLPSILPGIRGLVYFYCSPVDAGRVWGKVLNEIRQGPEPPAGLAEISRVSTMILMRNLFLVLHDLCKAEGG
jgi:hypothetical protein